MKHRNSTSEVQEWLWFGLKPEGHSATNSCLLGISEPTSSSMSATGLQQNRALMPTFCFFWGGERCEETWEVVNPNSRLKLYSSLPPVLQLTALISLRLTKLMERNHTWAGGNPSLTCQGMTCSWIFWHGLSCTMQVASLCTWFGLRDGGEGKWM